MNPRPPPATGASEDDPDKVYTVEKLGAYDLFDLSVLFEADKHLTI